MEFEATQQYIKQFNGVDRSDKIGLLTAATALVYAIVNDTRLATEEAQLRRAIHGPVVLIDSTLGETRRILQSWLRGLGEDEESRPLAKAVGTHFPGGRTDEGGIFTTYLGMQPHEIRAFALQDATSTRLPASQGLMILGDSPASTTVPQGQIFKQVVDIDGVQTGMNHFNVLSGVMGAHDIASRSGAPAFAIRYSHQLLTQSNMGRVETLLEPNNGPTIISPVNDSGLNGVSGRVDTAALKEITLLHGRNNAVVTKVGYRTHALATEGGDVSPPNVQVALHSRSGQNNGIDLSFQANPEQTTPSLLRAVVRAAFTGEKIDKDVVVAQMTSVQASLGLLRGILES